MPGSTPDSPARTGSSTATPPGNIVNRTLPCHVGDGSLLPKGGAQLKLSTPLRDAMFTENTRPRRKHNPTQLFWTFVAVCRDAIDRLEAEQIVVRPVLQCLED